MRIPLIDGLWPSGKCFRDQFASRVLILMYHCIAGRDYDPWEMCVAEQNFAEQLEVMNKIANPISLNQLTQKHREGNIPDQAVVVTFDDGYADNLYSAKPLLEHYGIPATVFVTSGYVKKEHGFWWDELEQVIMQPEALPDMLSLRINGSDFQWNLGQVIRDAGKFPLLKTGWLFGRQKEHNPRHSLYFSLHQFLQPMLEAEQREVLDQLHAWSGTGPDRLPRHPSLSQEELFTLSQGELVEVGAHTVTHALLSAHPAHRQLDELRQCKSDLEETTGQPVSSFSYPYGNYDKQTISLVQKAGFDCACSIVADSVWSGSDCYQFPRVGVKNWNGDEFAKWLSQVFTHAKTA